MTAAVPRSIRLEQAVWEDRHRWITRLLWLHAVGLGLVVALLTDFAVLHRVVELTPLLAFAAVATWSNPHRLVRSVAAATGLLTASALLVHVSGGMTDMHFHFFVMLGVIAIYQHWWPFLAAIAFVAAHHGVVGVLAPETLYDEAGGLAEPIGLAGFHVVFVVAASLTSVVSWRIVEDTHREKQAALEGRERHYRALIEHAADVVVVLDEGGIVRYASPASERVLGRVGGSRGRNALDLVHPDDVDRAVETLARALIGTEAEKHSELRLRHLDGSYRWVEATLTNLLAEPAVRGLVVNFRDITERRALLDQLEHEAFHDSLTGLANRALLLDRTDQALRRFAAGSAGRVAVVYVDLDDFKTVNDGLGHEAGDALLRVAAGRLVDAVRTTDTVARIGGDEFAVLLEDLTDPLTAVVLGTRVVEALRVPVDIGGRTVSPGASVGIAVGDGTEDAADLVRNADLAMYRAKTRGKGTSEVYESRMHTAVVERMAMKADLRRAIDSGELEPHYQPIVDLATEEVVAVEALARWHHPERGLMLPEEFIPLAEDTGLIILLGADVLRQACADLAAWRAELGDAAPGSVSVNLSARQVLAPGLVADVAAVLAETGLPGSALTLEVTESLLLERLDDASAILTALKELGVCIALDDFGTGYSSLSYLERFPVDRVKIDRSFVDGLGSSRTAPSLIRAIVDLSRALGLDVTAEGIEHGSQLAELRRIGCPTGQGFLFGRPADALDLVRSLRSRRRPEAVGATVPATAVEASDA